MGRGAAFFDRHPPHFSTAIYTSITSIFIASQQTSRFAESYHAAEMIALHTTFTH